MPDLRRSLGERMSIVAHILYLLGTALGLWSVSRLLRKRSYVQVIGHRKRVPLWWGGAAAAVVAFVAGAGVRYNFKVTGDQILPLVLDAVVVIAAIFAGAAFLSGIRRFPVPDRDEPQCSYRLVLVSMALAVLAYGAFVFPRVRQHGVVGMMPNTALVMLWPELPDSMVLRSPHTLRRRADLWEWQRDIIAWRARRIIEGSTNTKRVLRAIRMMAPADITFAPTMRQEVYADLILQCTDNDPEIAGPALERLETGETLALYLPDTLDEEHAKRLARHLEVVLQRPMMPDNVGAVLVLHRLGFLADILVPRVEEAIHTYIPGKGGLGPNEIVADACIRSLAKMSRTSDLAFEAFSRQFQHRSPYIRWRTCCHAGLITGRAEELEPLLIAATNSPLDDTASDAAESLVFTATDPCKHAEHLERISRRRPIIAQRVVLRLAGNCSSEAVLLMVERLLRSGDPAAQRVASVACADLGARAARYLPMLRAIAARGATHPDLADAARRAIASVESDVRLGSADKH